MAGLYLPENVPVVTVCAAGKTSEVAAALLDKKGYKVYSLDGGINLTGKIQGMNTIELEAGANRCAIS